MADAEKETALLQAFFGDHIAEPKPTFGHSDFLTELVTVTGGIIQSVPCTAAIF
jgi:hypothetical protein